MGEWMDKWAGDQMVGWLMRQMEMDRLMVD
jgi:hypothetical protein